MVKPLEWRERHPRCIFCEYLRFDTTASRLNIPCADYYECTVKKKIIKYPRLSRPWCPCFKVKYVAFNKEDINNKKEQNN